MNRIFSNGPLKDFVINPFSQLAASSARLYLAAPYFTEADPLRDAARAGKSIQLIVGLNAATSPQALAKIHSVPNLAVRFLTRRFHAKVYIFDDAALVGSSNLTDGGLRANREATIRLNQSEDLNTVEELRALFLELWDSAHVLTTETLETFAKAHAAALQKGPSPDEVIEKAVGRAEPANINVESTKKSLITRLTHPRR
jgi:phosphatidylserine/phosphatidylglycerophosphate/cardiolipin synthase-like enzyme